VDLDAEAVVRVEELDDQRKGVGRRGAFAEEAASEPGAELVQRLAGQGPVGDRRGIGRSVDEVPGLADPFPFRDSAVEALGQGVAAPDAFFQDRLETDQVSLHVGSRRSTWNTSP
jgi:hypothetical protein